MLNVLNRQQAIKVLTSGGNTYERNTLAPSVCSRVYTIRTVCLSVKRSTKVSGIKQAFSTTSALTAITVPPL